MSFDMSSTMSSYEEREQEEHSPNSEHDAKRRKIRKGTHSCWECRRRKIRCQFSSADDNVCVGCQARGSTCRSQEFIDEAPAPQPERKIAQRLGRLEQIMEKLVDKLLPEEADERPSSPNERRGPPSPICPTVAVVATHAHDSVDVFDTSTADVTPVATLLGIQETLSHSSSTAVTSPESDLAASRRARAAAAVAKYQHISKALHALFPPQEDVDAIVNGGAGSRYVLSLFYRRCDILQGRSEPPASVAEIPPDTSHPAIVAKRLVQLIVCMQMLSPAFYLQHKLHLKLSLADTIHKVSTTIVHTVTSNDELVGNVEGMECLILLGFQQVNAGNLRKAWMCWRRAMSLAQLMGIDRGSTRALKSCDPSADPLKRPTAEILWFRINHCDRYLSLLLGTPAGSPDDSFASEEAMAGNSPIERLEKKHSIILLRIIERNRSKSNQTYAVTQAIDCDLEAAARELGRTWWNAPNLDPFGTPDEMGAQMGRSITQVRHYGITILLHLPYMLRDPAENRYDYSKVTCMRSSREVLKRFLNFRKMVSSAYSSRHIDYSSLIAAMTLLLGYLAPRTATFLDESFDAQVQEDRALVEQVIGRMEHVSVVNKDKVSQESADVIKHLLPILDLVARRPGVPTPPASEEDLKSLHLCIPYLGKVNIHPGVGGITSAPSSASTAGPPPPAAPHIPQAQEPPVNAGAGAGAVAGAPGAPPESVMVGVSHGVEWPLQAPFATSTTATQGPDGQDLVPSTSGHDFGPMFLNFEPDGSPLSQIAFPDLTAESEDWTFQGVDKTYWQLLNGAGYFGA